MKWWPACVYGICVLMVWWSAEQQYLKIDGLGRSMTYLWRDWELTRSSTATWRVEMEAEGVFLYPNVCAWVRWRAARIQSWASELVRSKLPLFWPSTTFHNCSPQVSFILPGRKSSILCISESFMLLLCIFYCFCFLVLHHIFMQEYVGGSSWPTAVVCFHSSAYTCNLNMQYTTPHSVGNRRLNCLCKVAD